MAMMIQTSRFGPVEVDGERLIEFDEGILGFPAQKKYALIQTGRESGFYWLQSVEASDLAFVVCDPRLFVADYRVPVKMEDLEGIGLADPVQGQVFVIVNKVGDQLTGNFQGPLVVNVDTRRARQLVLSDKRYATRHPLMRIPKPGALSRTA
jgi:flagellar assembly factor FliW